MSDHERKRELARARAARWRAKHPGASAKAVAASRQRRKMKRGKADLAGVAAEIVKIGDSPWRNFQLEPRTPEGLKRSRRAKGVRRALLCAMNGHSMPISIHGALLSGASKSRGVEEPEGLRGHLDKLVAPQNRNGTWLQTEQSLLGPDAQLFIRALARSPNDLAESL